MTTINSENLQELFHKLTRPPDADSSPGLVAGTFDTFQVRRLLGCQGNGIVLLAWDPVLARKVVLKVYRRAELPCDLTSVLNEARALARVAHPCVAECYELKATEEVVYLVIEYVDGETLSKVLSSSRPTLARSLEIVDSIVAGLTGVHDAGLLHRDLKPSNVMILPDRRVKLIDFGLAVRPEQLIEGDSSGTAAYMAPEIARGETSQMDARSDIFGAGAILFHMLTGEPPFPGSTSESAKEQARRGAIPAASPRRTVGQISSQQGLGPPLASPRVPTGNQISFHSSH